METPVPKLLRSVLGRPHPNPLLLLCRLMVESAFKTACQTEHGKPTEDAQDAVLWLSTHLDWTDTDLIPPPDLREEYILSFEWCCDQLSLNADEVRAHGLPLHVSVTHRGRHNVHTRTILGGKHNGWHIFGLPDVYAHWQQAAQRARTSARARHYEQEQDEIFV